MSRYTEDPRWKQARRRKLRERPDCERCGKAATDAHHRDLRGLDGPLAYDIANLESLCGSCHSKHTAATTGGGWRPKGKRRRGPEHHPGLIEPSEARP